MHAHALTKGGNVGAHSVRCQQLRHCAQHRRARAQRGGHKGTPLQAGTSWDGGFTQFRLNTTCLQDHVVINLPAIAGFRPTCRGDAEAACRKSYWKLGFRGCQYDPQIKPQLSVPGTSLASRKATGQKRTAGSRTQLGVSEAAPCPQK